MDSPIAIGFDLSLTSAGVGVVGPGQIDTYSFGRKGKISESLEVRLDRLETLADQCVNVIANYMEWPLVATIEDAFNSAQGSAHDRAGLFWFVVKRLHDRRIPTVLVHNAKVKIYATGRGSGLSKDEVLLATVRRHPNAPIENNDQADAVNLALMGARLIGQPVDETPPKTHLRAMEGLSHPWDMSATGVAE